MKSPFKCFIGFTNSAPNPRLPAYSKLSFQIAISLEIWSSTYITPIILSQKNLQFYGPFLWMGFNCLKAWDTLQGGSLIFATKFPEIPGTHSISGISPQQPYHCPAAGNSLYLYILNMDS